jgi:superfamily II DNA/RNA helicase
VDDVALVIHADPPAEHKAYLHRSGRTARAGAAGTVITLMTDQQVSDVRALTRAAKIHPTTTRISGPDHAMLKQLAPGERVLVAGGLVDDRPAQPASRGGGGGGNGRRRGGSGGGRPQGGGGRGRSQGQSRGGQGGGQGGRSSSRRGAAGTSSSGGSHSAASFSSRRGSR